MHTQRQSVDWIMYYDGRCILKNIPMSSFYQRGAIWGVLRVEAGRRAVSVDTKVVAVYPGKTFAEDLFGPYTVSKCSKLGKLEKRK